MLKKRSGKSLIVLGLLTFVSILAMSSLGVIVFTAAKAVLDINTLPSFAATDNGNTFYCYRINGEGNSKNIAVGWGEAPENTPDNFTVPENLYNDDDSDTTKYTVVAIVKSGFSRCDFKKITLPDTILEIGNGAFAYCEKLEEFRIPPLVETIEDSTFVDCRKLKTITYTENKGTAETPNYVESTKNTIIQEIGDHAFDSCVELISFECPKSLTRIGVSAFQNCKKITRFYFPEKATYGNITVDSYAFADCASLIWVYFEENLTTIRNYAFANCNTNMLFHYGHNFGSSTPTNPTFSDTEWNRKSIDGDNPARYGFEETYHVIYSAEGYLGLKVGIESTDVYLNSWRETTESPNNTIKLINSSSGQYAIVYQWDNPGKDIKLNTDDFYYYRYNGGGNGSGVLTIPSTIKYNDNEIPIKVIRAEAFKECKDLKEVHFKNNIVQIQEKAFYNCTNIDTLDFNGVTTLREIGPNIFGADNGKVTSLELPSSLEYIGPSAFNNFTKVASLKFTTAADRSAGRHTNLKVIGNSAFNGIGKYLSSGSYIKINIPCSLDDSEAIKASMHSSGKNWAAVGNKSFSSAKIITIEMDNCPNGVHASNNISLAESAFEGCSNLTRFVAGDNLCLIGSNAFKNCTSLKEVFLTTTKAAAYASAHTNNTYVWGTTNAGASSGISIFGDSTFPNLVIYLDGPAPGNIEAQKRTTLVVNSTSTSMSTSSVWNAEGTAKSAFSSGLGYSSKESDRHTQGRKTIPTYYNIDFSMMNKTSVIYYDVSSGTTMSQAPDTTAQYFAGVIVFVKEGSKYTAAKYYTDHNHAADEINLTGITHSYAGGTVNISANLTKIGPGAFASDQIATDVNQAPCPGKYFILPTTVTEIGERAFYRTATDTSSPSVDDVVTNGVRIVTYASGNTGANYGENYVYATIKSQYGTNKFGYCNIPDVTKIGSDAFINNRFKAINLGSGVEYLGRSAFYTRYSNVLSSINITTNSYFEAENNGIYYIGQGNAKKSLILQEQNDSSTSLTIADDTVAVGPAAVANTNYTSIDLNDVTHIYGSSFQNNSSLTTVTGGTELKYIGAMPETVFAYKVEKQKYLGLTNLPLKYPKDVNFQDDLTSYGTVAVNTTSTEKLSNIPLDDKKMTSDGLYKSLFKFTSSNGTILYGCSNNANATSLKVGTETFFVLIERTVDDVDILDTKDATLMSHLDLIDYRKTSDINFAEYQNRTSAFQGCESLTTINFQDMDDLIKIGNAAFNGCKNLETMTRQGSIYKYYKYDSSSKTVSSFREPDSGNKGVLDLSECTSLRSIGAQAFTECEKIKYVHLPYTKGKLFVGRDLQTPFNVGKSINMEGQPVFKEYDNADDKIIILVGDHEVAANPTYRDANSYSSVHVHYKSGWQANNYVYYYAESINDIRDMKNQGNRYWTTNPNDSNGYILFDSLNAAKDYFNTLTNNPSQIVWPS